MSPEPSAEMQAVFSMAGISKSGPQYKDKILPADDNFLKIVTVGGGYLEEVRVLCVADKGGGTHARHTGKSVLWKHHPQRSDRQIGDCPEKAMEQSAECEEKLTALLEDKEKALLLRLINAENEIGSTMALENFILGFRLGVRMILEALDEDDGSLLDPNKEG